MTKLQPLTWFAKPAWLSPLHCATFGWKNTDYDVLTCVTCKAIISGRMPKSDQHEVCKYHPSSSLHLPLIISSHSLSICQPPFGRKTVISYPDWQLGISGLLWYDSVVPRRFRIGSWLNLSWAWMKDLAEIQWKGISWIKIHPLTIFFFYLVIMFLLKIFPLKWFIFIWNTMNYFFTVKT